MLTIPLANDTNDLDASEVWSDTLDAIKTAGMVTLIVLGVTVVIVLVLNIAIAKKAGYSGWWGALGVLIPPLGMLLFVIFALAKWPALKERDEALGVLGNHNLVLASHERKAIKELEGKQKIEEAARKRMEKAQTERERVEAERARFQQAQVRAADAAAPAVSTPPPPAPTTAPAVDSPPPPPPPAPTAKPSADAPPPPPAPRTTKAPKPPAAD